MSFQIRQIPDAVRSEQMNSEALRQHFLLDGMFIEGNSHFTYVDQDRAVVGSIVPTRESIPLENDPFLKAAFFTERREAAVMNIGASGSIRVDGKSFDMNHRDALYIGAGSRNVQFSSIDHKTPARFYLVSYPAHHTYPTRHAQISDAEPLHLGSDAESNKRTIYKYIYPGGIDSCQLVMGFTEMAPGSVWNTMPAHRHMRRTEIYLYFNLDPQAAVFHLMGRPEETRHIVVRNEQAVFSPGWSIHAGSGTSNYSFIWAMGGENRDYTDMDPVSIASLK